MPRAAKTPNGLTVQQEEFALQCIRLGSPARAYRKVYDATAMTQHVVWNEARKLLNQPQIATRVEHFQEVANKAADVTVEKIAREAARIAFFDPRELFDDTGRPIPISELPEDAARAIAGIDVESLFEGPRGAREKVGDVLKYKIANKITALELLAKWKKMLVDQVEHGKPGAFTGSKEELQKRIKGRMVRLGLAKVVDINKAKKKTA